MMSNNSDNTCDTRGASGAAGGIRPGSVYFDTLGCPKNVNDSEYAAGMLERAGFDIADDPADADFIIVNTCAFIEDAKKESIEHIFNMNALKRGGAKLIVAGCLAQRYAEELFDDLPEADCFVGVNEYEKLPEILKGLSADGRRAVFAGACGADTLARASRRFSSRPYSSTLKIAEGCDNRCTYCVIPDIRGKYRSKSMEDCVSEAEELAAAGCRELVLIAQDTTYYGLDLYGKQMLPELLRRLCAVDGIEWIRLMYCYDERITDELIETIADEPKICKYIDIPLQHASDRVLKAMNRHTSRRSIEETVTRLRSRVLGIRIRTTFIVGFPGESDEDYEQLVDFIEDEKFDRLGVFAYSREEGTPAARMRGQIDDDVKQARLDGIMTRQMEISRAHNEEMIGKTYRVMVDGKDEDGSYYGRTMYDAPEIDNSVLFTSRRPLERGDFADVLITDAFDYDISGEEI